MSALKRGPHKVINAVNDEVLLDGVTSSQFDQWYDYHYFWRQPRDLSEVAPHIRTAYEARDDFTHYLVNA